MPTGTDVTYTMTHQERTRISFLLQSTQERLENTQAAATEAKAKAQAAYDEATQGLSQVSQALTAVESLPESPECKGDE